MANNNVRIPNNEIFEAGAYCNDLFDKEGIRLMKDIVKYNILSDYKIKGVKTLEISLFPTNIKNIYGITRKQIKNGNIIKLQELCIFKDVNGNDLYLDEERNPIKWKVLSRTFIYNGQPLIKLKLQEVKN